MSKLIEQVLEDKAREFRESLYTVLDDMAKRRMPDYYMRRFYGKYHIFDKEGKRVASRLTKQQADAYMKLLKED